MEPNEVSFRLIRVVTEQFATIESAFVENETIMLRAGIDYAINEDSKMIGCFTRFEFVIKELPFIIINVKCDFQIEDSTWNNNIDKESKTITFPKGFMCHLAVITVGSTRGVLHAKTENTKFNQYFLPTVNVNDFIKNDISFTLQKI